MLSIRFDAKGRGGWARPCRCIPRLATGRYPHVQHRMWPSLHPLRRLLRWRGKAHGWDVHGPQGFLPAAARNRVWSSSGAGPLQPRRAHLRHGRRRPRHHSLPCPRRHRRGDRQRVPRRGYHCACRPRCGGQGGSGAGWCHRRDSVPRRLARRDGLRPGAHLHPPPQRRPSRRGRPCRQVQPHPSAPCPARPRSSRSSCRHPCRRRPRCRPHPRHTQGPAPPLPPPRTRRPAGEDQGRGAS
mmetsp:Transcript_36780/g.79537  ORF Transcript_36780/g.79537 Transcript_36780/m.79537 type:complete len:241 (+) Transcript_36780:98-820(+)